MWIGGRVARLLGGGAGASAVDPSMFAAGSCLRYPPTTGDRHLTVFVDAGHGGLDPGGVGTTESGRPVPESGVNLPIELDALAGLRAQGFTVVVSRTTDSTVLLLGPADTDGQLLTLQGIHDDVAARADCANLAKADLLVGISMDTAASAGAGGSLTTYDTARPFAPSSLRLADLLQHDVLAAMNAQGWAIPDRGVVSDATEGSTSGNPADGGLAAQASAYHHLLLLGPAAPGYFTTPSQMPGALIEPLFLTDPFEGTIAASGPDQAVIAQGIVTAVGDYFGPQSTTTTSS